jgi:transitional endoplasmic reticulum ATPase
MNLKLGLTAKMKALALRKLSVTNTKTTTKKTKHRMPKKAIAEIEDVKEEKFSDVEVVRQGDQIILPEGMTYAEGREWLRRQEEAEEKVVDVYDNIQGYFPTDSAYALLRAIKMKFGFASLNDTRGFFGQKVPPMLVNVLRADGTEETALFGACAPPKWEGGTLEITADIQRGQPPALDVTGKVKKKFEASVKEVFALARQILKEDSLYRGEAIIVDYTSIDEDRQFDPLKDAPKFIDTDNVADENLILRQQTMFDLEANIFTLIRNSDACRQNGMTLRHGCLLAGPFGTGKTLASLLTAKIAKDNDWTFIYLKQTGHLASAIKMAEHYAPAVVFAEDIDQVVKAGVRNAGINEILNTIDGVDTKSKEVITVYTTNYQERIEPALLRAGRIDTVIRMHAPDAETAARFIQFYARDDERRSLLADDFDLAVAGKAMDGFVPAFIAEAIHKAKRYAINRVRSGNIVGAIKTEDVIYATNSLKEQSDMAAENLRQMTPEEKLYRCLQFVEFAGMQNNAGDKGSLQQLASHFLGWGNK